MQRVFVLAKNRQSLMPCHPARARELLQIGRAKVYRRYPFTIILVDRSDGETQPVQAKFDPSSRTTGIALVADFKQGKRVIWAGELTHKGHQIKAKLLARRQLRRGRKTRYRQPRFNNRTRPQGWLPPSLQSRVDNLRTWAEKLHRFASVTSWSMELVRFDTQALANAEISGIEYQQGELQGYEVREYLLEKWGRTCAYCGDTDTRLEIEHITPKSRGGSNRVSNLTIACHACNQQKGNQTAHEFGFPDIQKQAKKPLKDAASVNATRWAIYHILKDTDMPVKVGTGGRTKFNRRQQNYPKTHWLDAVCVGESGTQVYVDANLEPLHIKAIGRGSRQMCRMDKYGFPRTKPKQFKQVRGFKTGDMVVAKVPKGKYAGTHLGRIAIRSNGNFRLGKIDLNWKYCRLLQYADGYEYTKGAERNSPPR